MEENCSFIWYQKKRKIKKKVQIGKINLHLEISETLYTLRRIKVLLRKYVISSWKSFPQASKFTFITHRNEKFMILRTRSTAKKLSQSLSKEIFGWKKNIFLFSRLKNKSKYYHLWFFRIINKVSPFLVSEWENINSRLIFLVLETKNITFFAKMCYLITFSRLLLFAILLFLSFWGEAIFFYI